MNGDFSGKQPEVAKKLQSTFGAMTTEMIEPCIAAAQSFDVDTTVISSEASTFVRNEGALDQISTAATRFSGLLDGTEENNASYAIWGGVIFLELAFFIFKFFYNRADTPSEPTVKPNPRFDRRLASIVRKLGQADARGYFQIDQELLEAKSSDVRREIEDLLEDLYEHKEAIRANGAFGPKILKPAYKRLRDALSGEAAAPQIVSPNPPRPSVNGDAATAAQPDLDSRQFTHQETFRPAKNVHQEDSPLGFSDRHVIFKGPDERPRQNNERIGKPSQRNPHFMDMIMTDD
ncbi:MAG: hypothetical protein WA790_02690 [Sulfitobacter sp.]